MSDTDTKPDRAALDAADEEEAASQPASPVKARSEKLTITIVHGDQQLRFGIKRHAQFAKMFKAATDRWNVDPAAFRFMYNGQRVRPEETPEDHDMEDDDQIDALAQQVGGA